MDYLFGQKGSKRINKHNIIEDKPNPNSLAGYILLKQMYRYRDSVRRPKDREWRMWLTFRNKLIKKIRKKNKGKLVCAYCGKEHLNANHGSRTAVKGYKATLDHVIPLAKGGAKYDPRNLVVACDTCNGSKADLSLEEFEKKIA